MTKLIKPTKALKMDKDNAVTLPQVETSNDWSQLSRNLLAYGATIGGTWLALREANQSRPVALVGTEDGTLVAAGRSNEILRNSQLNGGGSFTEGMPSWLILAGLALAVTLIIEN